MQCNGVYKCCIARKLDENGRATNALYHILKLQRDVLYMYYARLSTDVLLSSKRRSIVKYSLVGADNLKVTQLLCKKCSTLYIQSNL